MSWILYLYMINTFASSLKTKVNRTTDKSAAGTDYSIPKSVCHNNLIYNSKVNKLFQ